MTREELTKLVRKSNATTLIANRMRRALGLREIWRDAAHRGHSGAGKQKSKYVNRGRYKHARKLMQQKHGVNL